MSVGYQMGQSFKRYSGMFGALAALAAISGAGAPLGAALGAAGGAGYVIGEIAEAAFDDRE